MNYSWNWGVLLQPTGIGQELYWHWLVKGFGWLLVIGTVGWLIALMIGTVLGIMRTLPNKTARAIGTAYVSFFAMCHCLFSCFFGFM